MNALLKEANERGIDIFEMIQIASRIGVLGESSIMDDKAVLQEISPLERIVDQDPSILAAKKLPSPTPIHVWDEYAERQKVDDSESILFKYASWEKFWQAACFDTEQYTREEIIQLTLDSVSKGQLTRRQLDSRFPDTPSSSYVKEIFGGIFSNYTKAVADARLEIEKARRLVTPALKSSRATSVALGPLTKDDIIKQYSTVRTIYNTPIKVFRFYGGAKKMQIRDNMAQDVLDHIIDSNPRKLKYIGLEGVNFRSYITLQRLLENSIDPRQSTIVEEDKMTAETMRTIVLNHNIIEGGEIFYGLQISHDHMHGVLRKNRNKKYDILNMDYMGGWSRTKQEALDNMFKYGNIADKAMLYFTLLDSPLERKRVRDGCSQGGIVRIGFGSEDQQALVELQLDNLCKQFQYCWTRVQNETYKDSQPMLFLGYHIMKKTAC